jgi:hypothetical protein
MAKLIFPKNPVDGQLYPNPPISGANVYRFAAAYNTWRLIGRSNGVPAGTYGGNKTPVQITIDATGIISKIENKPIPPATLTSSGLMQPGIGLGVADNQGLVNVIPPTASNIGGVKAGPNINIDPTGIISVPDSSFVTKGVVKLNDTLTSTSTSEALTAAKGKQLQDQINSLQFNSLIFCGIYNASTSSLDYVTSEGTSKGFVKGDNIPPPQESLNGCFVIVSRSGTPQPPAPQQLLESGDWLVIDTDPLQWVDIPIGRNIVAQQIDFTPVPNLPETNVQDAIAYIQLELDDIQIDTGEGLVGGPITRYGTISLAPPTKTTIGGVKAGPNIVISADGLISVQPGGNVGTITEIRTANGITGGPITTTGEISLADSPVIPGFYKYASVAVDQKGRLVSAVKGDDPVLVKDYLNKGDLLVGSGAGVYTQFPIGSNGQVLAVDVTTPSGLKWTNESPTGVTEVNTGEGLTGGPIVSSGTISIKPATIASLGGVKPDGTSITISPEGVITAVPSGSGTVKQINTGVGLSGGPITDTGTVSLIPATDSEIGGVKPDGVTIKVTTDGTLSAVSAGAERQTVSGTTAILNDGQLGNLDITGFKSYALMKIECTDSAWVRIYTDPASRAADASRNIGNDPLPGTGVIAEANIVSPSSSVSFAPFTLGGNLENPVGTKIYLAVQNLSGTSKSFSISLTILPLEF